MSNDYGRDIRHFIDAWDNFIARRSRGWSLQRYWTNLMKQVDNIFHSLIRIIGESNIAICSFCGGIYVTHADSVCNNRCAQITRILLYLKGYHYNKKSRKCEKRTTPETTSRTFREYLECIVGSEVLLRLYGRNKEHQQIIAEVSEKLRTPNNLFGQKFEPGLCENIDFGNILFQSKSIGTGIKNRLEQLSQQWVAGKAKRGHPAPRKCECQNTNQDDAQLQQREDKCNEHEGVLQEDHELMRSINHWTEGILYPRVKKLLEEMKDGRMPGGKCAIEKEIKKKIKEKAKEVKNTAATRDEGTLRKEAPTGSSTPALGNTGGMAKPAPAKPASAKPVDTVSPAKPVAEKPNAAKVKPSAETKPETGQGSTKTVVKRKTMRRMCALWMLILVTHPHKFDRHEEHVAQVQVYTRGARSLAKIKAIASEDELELYQMAFEHYDDDEETYEGAYDDVDEPYEEAYAFSPKRIYSDAPWEEEEDGTILKAWKMVEYQVPQQVHYERKCKITHDAREEEVDSNETLSADVAVSASVEKSSTSLSKVGAQASLPPSLQNKGQSAKTKQEPKGSSGTGTTGSTKHGKQNKAVNIKTGRGFSRRQLAAYITYSCNGYTQYVLTWDFPPLLPKAKAKMPKKNILTDKISSEVPEKPEARNKP
ncbi:hypothetical protein AK88_05544 [Plasmodium fragile]|uniref:Schizont-infected cell agglutination extracellular alpha domain-containing protein n=1 Tax=Plasmodium fragile TaxID=5857 RepID=A0A0D9QGH7_PLAFR|nr:uncharacterized protein AK88_05544 [Plasmodium fragile]KJP84826.1 hypothetical protein AK88_05544 [Plasmodium fragile]